MSETQHGEYLFGQSVVGGVHVSVSQEPESTGSDREYSVKG